MEKLAYALVFIALMFAVLNILTNQDKDEPPPRTPRRKSRAPLNRTPPSRQPKRAVSTPAAKTWQRKKAMWASRLSKLPC